MIDIHVYVNGESVKDYSIYKDDNLIVCPRVGEYIELPDYVIDDDDNYNENGYIEVLVTKVVHNLEYDDIHIYTQTKRRKTK